MKLAKCSGAGPEAWISNTPEERRGGTEVLIDIVNPVGIELDLVVVEVEVRAVRPLAIGVPVLLLII